MTTLKTKLLLGALSLLLATGAWALHERDNRLRAEGRAEVLSEAYDSLELAHEAAERNAELSQTRVDSVKTEADSIRAQSERQISDLRRYRPALVDTLIVEAGPDSTVVREAVERVSASYEAEISELQRATIAARATIDTQADYIEALEIKERASRALIANLQGQVEALSLTKPGFMSRNTERIAIGLAGVAIGYIGSGIGR